MVCCLSSLWDKSPLSSLRPRHLFNLDCFEITSGSVPNDRSGIREVVVGESMVIAITYSGIAVAFLRTGTPLQHVTEGPDLLVKCAWYHPNEKAFLLATVSSLEEYRILRVYLVYEAEVLLSTTQRRLPTLISLEIGKVSSPGFAEFERRTGLLLVYAPTSGMQTGFYRIFSISTGVLYCLLKLAAGNVIDIRLSRQYILVQMDAPTGTYIKVIRPPFEPAKLQTFSIRLPVEPGPCQMMDLIGSLFLFQQEGQPLICYSLESESLLVIGQPHGTHRTSTETSSGRFPYIFTTDAGDCLAYLMEGTLRILDVSLGSLRTLQSLEDVAALPVMYDSWRGVWFFHGVLTIPSLGSCRGLHATLPSTQETKLLMMYDDAYLTAFSLVDDVLYLGNANGIIQAYGI
ncbi:hypothetical protein GMRT_14315 [Giardia muris]|uniref:Cleavage/polyadenylation specificity factor A subunit N-terminal domain-containing protein n=1 Tax=Giardia muris TaxID=5742 RepID=A0A4Z1SWK5_GIAMU|nr:hypothetical protein GMRT_14315 [Giardia muris]|eukprot:TNJ30144.1 hypothetical protein GMRT_14315 [Giardia muris]